jgi:NADPH2:quinone reductase
MQAIEIVENRLSLTTRPVPSIASTQVLIQVEAAGINRPDIMQKQGVYPPPPGASDIPGLEVAGVIIQVGSEVSHLNIGDRVCALVTGGGYAQFCAAEADLCLPIPENFSFVQAAALPETLFTVWHNLFQRSVLSQGQILLVHGGSSGIGTTAIQLAKAFGCRVIITAGSEAKCEACLKLGADFAIPYRSQDFVAAVRDWTQDSGVHVILDMIGGDYTPRNLKCLADEGVLVQIAIQQGAIAEINLWRLMLKRLTITGSTLRGRSVAVKKSIADDVYQRVWPLLKQGQVQPVIDCVYPLNEAASAHARMESSEHIGKIMLKVGS